MTPEQAAAELELIEIEKERRRRASAPAPGHRDPNWLARSQAKQNAARAQQAIDDERGTDEEGRPVVGTSPVVDTIGHSLMGAADAMSLGLADEVRGIATAVPHLIPGGESPADAYVRGRDEQRAVTTEAADRSPLAYGVGDLAGTILPGIVGGANGAARAAIPKLIREGAKAGAVAGGTSAFGHGDGAADSLAAVPDGAAVGALLGGASAGLGGKLMNALGPARLKLARSTPESQARALELIPAVGKPLAAARRALGAEGGPSPEYAAMLREQLAEGAPSVLPRVPTTPSAPRLTPLSERTTTLAEDIGTPSPSPSGLELDVTAAPKLQKAPVAGPAGDVRPDVTPATPTSTNWMATAEQLRTGTNQPELQALLDRAAARHDPLGAPRAIPIPAVEQEATGVVAAPPSLTTRAPEPAPQLASAAPPAISERPPPVSKPLGDALEQRIRAAIRGNKPDDRMLRDEFGVDNAYLRALRKKMEREPHEPALSYFDVPPRSKLLLKERAVPDLYGSIMPEPPGPSAAGEFAQMAPKAPPAPPRAPLTAAQLKAEAVEAVAKGEPLKALAKRLRVNQGDVSTYYKAASIGH